MEKNNRLKLSVVVPSFNQGVFIKRTIDSVLGQDYKNIEVFVVDGGSTDNTLEILKSYGDRIRWVSEKDNGQTDAINKGIRLTNGDIFCYLNSDDVFVENKIGSVISAFANNPEVSWVTGDYEIIDANDNKIQSYIVWYKRFLRKTNNVKVMAIANFIIQPSTFFRRLVIEKVGYFNDRLKFTMDYDYWFRLYAKFGKPLILNSKLSRFRIHTHSKGGSAYVRQFSEEMETQKKNMDTFLVSFFHKLHCNVVVSFYNLIK